MEHIIFHNTHGFICKGIHVTTISEKAVHGFERGCGQWYGKVWSEKLFDYIIISKVNYPSLFFVLFSLLFFLQWCDTERTLSKSRSLASGFSASRTESQMKLFFCANYLALKNSVTKGHSDLRQISRSLSTTPREINNSIIMSADFLWLCRLLSQ